jgi:type IV pilus assembly protein PilX
MKYHFQKPLSRKESGAVLYTGLIFLLVLSMIVLSMLRSGTMEERMAANARNKQIALQAAEAVLRDAEKTLFTDVDFISKFDSIPIVENTGIYGPPAVGTPLWKTVDWTSTTKTLTFTPLGTTPGGGTPSVIALGGVASAPRYFVEIINPPTRPNSTVPCSTGVATVTARGVGPDASTTIVQATYRYLSNRPNDGC